MIIAHDAKLYSCKLRKYNFMALFGVELNAQINRLVHQIKLTLAENRYWPNFRTIYQAFVKYDPEQTGWVSPTGFNKALNDNKIFLKKYELQIFEKVFKDKGMLNWFGFMSLLRQKMSDYRINVVESIFDTLDTQQNGKIHINELMKRFNASEFKEFKLGYKSQQKIGEELLGLIPLTPDGCMTKEEFVNFYTDLSINISSDQNFGRFVCSHFNCEYSPPAKSTPQMVKAAIKNIRFNLIQKTQGTHEEFLLRQVFDEFDINKNGSLSENELDAMLVKLEIPTEQRLVIPLLKKLDHNKNGAVEYDQFKNFLFFDPYPI